VSGTAWKAKAELLQRRYNIQVIPCRISPDFAEVGQFIEAVSFAARPIAPKVEATPGLRRVVLENIGPFERLEVDFPAGHNWKILLGDNGVGKSTVLKAIAVAMMGSDARSFAGRLVRAGQTRGRITVSTGQNPAGYVTEILTKD